MVRLYIFADRFNVPLLRPAIIDKQWLLAQDFYAPFPWRHEFMPYGSFHPPAHFAEFWLTNMQNTGQDLERCVG